MEVTDVNIGNWMHVSGLLASASPEGVLPAHLCRAIANCLVRPMVIGARIAATG